MRLVHEIHHSLRSLRRSPGFALAIAATLGLGLGANIAMLTAVEQLMFRPFPYLRDPATVHRVYFETSVRGKRSTRSAGPYTTYLDLQHATSAFSQFAAFTEWQLALGQGDAVRERNVAGVSASFFDFFNARPQLGRFFTTSDDTLPRGAAVAVLAYGYWQTEYGGHDVIGRRLDVGPLTTTIIGVAPKGFVGVSEGEAPAVFLPITTLAYGVNQGDAQSFATKYVWYWMNVMVRRKPRVSTAAATADLTNAFIQSREKQRASLPSTSPLAIAHPRAIVGSLKTFAGPDAGLESRTLLWVTGVAVIVLLITCANLANLLLARLLRRQREFAVRRAIGMSSLRLLEQLAADALVLATLGAVAGAAMAQVLTVVLARLALRSVGTTVAVDWRMFVIAGALALGAAAITYLVPALVALKSDFTSSLRSGPRAGTHTHGPLQAALLGAQAMLAVILLVGAGLFVRSLSNAESVRLGWNPAPVLVVTPNYRAVQMDRPSFDAFRRRLLDATQAIPGVAAAARVDNLPFLTSTRDLFVDGIDSVPRLGRFISQVVSPDYFKVMDTHIRRGRALDSGDRADAAPAAVISESMGRVLWPGRDALGQCMHVGSRSAPCTRVVGIAEDVAGTGIADEDRFSYYLSDDQPPQRPANRIFIRVAAGDPLVYTERVRRALRGMMPGNAYVTIAPLEDLVDAQRRSWTLGATMFGAFGVLALLVAAVGLYAVMSYQVVQRHHELGVRIALGAQSGHILRLIIGRGLLVVGAGASAGLVVASGAARWMQPLLFHQSGTDPTVYSLVAGAIIVVAIAASLIPALRAVRVEPGTALTRDG